MRNTLVFLSLLACLGAHATVEANVQRLGAPAPESINGVAGGGIVADPSFEDGSPNSFWTEASTTFGTPLCTVNACGSGGSAAPVRTGLWWAWFGGAQGTETGSVSQSVTIPAGVIATLNFGFQAPVCVASTQNFVEARINGMAVWRADGTGPLCGVSNAYTDIAVDVSQFAGQTVTLSFDSTTSGGTTNFFVDDVQITAVARPVPAPTLSWTGLALLMLTLGAVGIVAVRRNA